MKRTSFVLLAGGLTTLLVACSGADALSIKAAEDSGAATTTTANTGDDDSGVTLPQEPISDGSGGSPIVSDAAAPPVTFLDASGLSDGSAGSTLDGSTTALNGCTATDFANNDASAATASRTLDLSENTGGRNGGGGNIGDRPICRRIKAGETLTFTANFDNASLEPLGGTTPSPIVSTKTGQSVTFTFAAAGTFGFTRAATRTELGAIDVVP